MRSGLRWVTILLRVVLLLCMPVSSGCIIPKCCQDRIYIDMVAVSRQDGLHSAALLTLNGSQ